MSQEANDRLSAYVLCCGNCGEVLLGRYVNWLALEYAEHMRNVHGNTNWHGPEGCRLVPEPR